MTPHVRIDAIVSGTHHALEAKMKVYVAGLIANGGTLPRDEVYANCARFDRVAAALRALGHVVVNPVELGDPRVDATIEITPKNHHACMRRDLKQLLDCDVICLLENWTASTGAQLEHKVALGVGMGVMRERDIC